MFVDEPKGSGIGYDSEETGDNPPDIVRYEPITHNQRSKTRADGEEAKGRLIKTSRPTDLEIRRCRFGREVVPPWMPWA
jgi:hypothetical protein